jgi:3'(2'), 5'-bisphosphate nucleotidase
MTNSALPSFHIPDHAAFLQALAREAGGRIMAHRAAATENTKRKLDGSPVTAADHEAQQIIIAGLAALTPDIPVVAEEKVNPQSLAESGTYWLVDPLDGTLAFVQGERDFSVNIGLIVNGEPVLGVIYAPAYDDMFYGEPGTVSRVKKGVTTQLQAATEVKAPEMVSLITSRREARKLPIADWQREGFIGEWRICSSAYKFGLLAAGAFDLFIRTGLTFEWDTAAGDALVRAVGGSVMVTATDKLVYGKPDFRNGNFIAHGASFDAGRLPEFFARLKKENA